MFVAGIVCNTGCNGKGIYIAFAFSMHVDAMIRTHADGPFNHLGCTIRSQGDGIDAGAGICFFQQHGLFNGKFIQTVHFVTGYNIHLNPAAMIVDFNRAF